MVVVLAKLALLLGLWWLFVRDAAVPIDAPRAAAHLVQIEPLRQPPGARGVKP